MSGEQHLAAMLKADERLYEQCLDTPVFAYHFNQLARLACDRKVSAEVELRRIGNELALWLPAPIGDDVRKQLYKLAKQVESFSAAPATTDALVAGTRQRALDLNAVRFTLEQNEKLLDDLANRLARLRSQPATGEGEAVSVIRHAHFYLRYGMAKEAMRHLTNGLLAIDGKLPPAPTQREEATWDCPNCGCVNPQTATTCWDCFRAKPAVPAPEAQESEEGSTS